MDKISHSFSENADHLMTSLSSNCTRLKACKLLRDYVIQIYKTFRMKRGRAYVIIVDQST